MQLSCLTSLKQQIAKSSATNKKPADFLCQQARGSPSCTGNLSLFNHTFLFQCAYSYNRDVAIRQHVAHMQRDVFSFYDIKRYDQFLIF